MNLKLALKLSLYLVLFVLVLNFSSPPAFAGGAKAAFLNYMRACYYAKDMSAFYDYMTDESIKQIESGTDIYRRDCLRNTKGEYIANIHFTEDVDNGDESETLKGWGEGVFNRWRTRIWFAVEMKREKGKWLFVQKAYQHDPIDIIRTHT